MVVILDPPQYDEWLTCPVADAPKFFKQWMGQLDAYPAPLPPRAKKTKLAEPTPTPEHPDSEALF